LRAGGKERASASLYIARTVPYVIEPTKAENPRIITISFIHRLIAREVYPANQQTSRVIHPITDLGRLRTLFGPPAATTSKDCLTLLTDCYNPPSTFHCEGLLCP
jgi:hypothetical protein